MARFDRRLPGPARLITPEDTPEAGQGGGDSDRDAAAGSDAAYEVSSSESHQIHTGAVHRKIAAIPGGRGWRRPRSRDGCIPVLRGGLERWAPAS